jgi:hypothetical protein
VALSCNILDICRELEDDRGLDYQRVWVLGPKDWDRASDNHEGAENRLVVEGFVRTIDDLLCFHKVGNVTLSVNTSTGVSDTCIMPGTPSDQNEGELLGMIFEIYKPH